MGKYRQDFVTNSSSASYVICFARIADEDKARKIIDKYDLEISSVENVKKRMDWLGFIGADWCGAYVDAKKVIEKYPDSNFVIITEKQDADYDEDCEPIYSYNFEADEVIGCINVKNGFGNVEIAEGEGRDG
jgi:hypothetical protein